MMDTASLRTWHLWLQATDALRREPDPVEMDAISDKMADTDSERFTDTLSQRA